MFRLEGRVALVTGGSRGIGASVCGVLGSLGARVAVGYHLDARAAAAVVEGIVRVGGEAVALRGDLSRTEDADRVVRETVERFGALDILVANQGIWKRAPLPSMLDAQWHETLDTNLTGVFATCRAAARAMGRRGSGAIVLVSSTAGQRGEAHYSHYAASKGALLALTKSFAAELAPSGIRVNAIAPGWVLTDMTRDVLEGSGAESAVRAIPRRRAGSPEEIAWPIAFLCSEWASYVWGEVLCVNGGAVMTD